MSDYSSMSAPPPPEGYGASTRGEKPASIKTAINIIWASVALSVLSTILTFVFLDQLIDRALEANGGAGAATGDAARSGAIIGAVVGLVIGVGLYVLLAIFLGKGKNWARIVLTVLAGIGLVFGLISLTGGQPILLLIVQIISLALSAALIYFLWQKDSSRWLTGKG